MKLYHSAASPFVRKVMVVLHETGQLDDVERVDITLSPVAPSAVVRAANPLSKLPTLERADGPALYDSRVICAYLDARANAMLYGDGALHWDILTLEATADGIMDAAIAARYESFVRPEDKRWPDWSDAQIGKALSAIRSVDRIWLAHLAKPLSWRISRWAARLATWISGTRPETGAPRRRDWPNGTRPLPRARAWRPPGPSERPCLRQKRAPVIRKRVGAYPGHTLPGRGSPERL
jgi:glutathione S-transferase